MTTIKHLCICGYVCASGPAAGHAGNAECPQHWVSDWEQQSVTTSIPQESPASPPSSDRPHWQRRHTNTEWRVFVPAITALWQAVDNVRVGRQRVSEVAGPRGCHPRPTWAPATGGQSEESQGLWHPRKGKPASGNVIWSGEHRGPPLRGRSTVEGMEWDTASGDCTLSATLPAGICKCTTGMVRQASWPVQQLV